MTDKAPQARKTMARSSASSPSVQAQLELNDIPVAANEPGPGHYYGEGSAGFSSFGEQRIAKCASAPSHSFPNGWDKWGKVFISKSHGAIFMGREGEYRYNPQIPGCNDGLSTISTTVGKALRPGLEKSLGIDPHGSPGPQYNVRDDPPRMEDRLAAPKDKSFGKSERFAKERAGSLGPGQYTSKDVALRSETGRTFGVGRAAYDKVLRPGWETEGQCKTSPGVGPPMWRDLKRDGGRGACPFSTANRFPKEKGTDVPGPGMYRQSERDMGATMANGSVCAEARRPASTKFGVTMPKKPRFRMHLANNTSKNAGWGYF